MDRAEIDSFIVKFKTLLLSGKNATLLMKSNHGKAEVSLHAELGDVPLVPAHSKHPGSRDGPSRQRRRQRRAAESDALKADNALNDENKAVEATHIEVVAEDVTTTNENVEINSVTEEVTVAEDHAAIDKVAATNINGESERFNEDNKNCNDTIKELSKKS